MTENKGSATLVRGLSLTQATAINMIDMVGIGPFITLPIIAGVMHGPAGIFAWLLGALLAFMDGLVWAELGAAWPEAGGSYVFLQKIFGSFSKELGKVMAFLFIWQTTIQAPLVIASGAIGFSKYFGFLVPLNWWQQKAVSGALVLALVAILYRNIKGVGKISVILWLITGGTFLWLIFSGIGHFHAAQAFGSAGSVFQPDLLLMAALGQATLKATYSYLGYYNVCHLGAEIKDPARNIPRSIMISVAGIAVVYLLMQILVLGVIPWQQVAKSDFVVSVYFEQIYQSHLIGQIATLLILVIALASLFSAMLGYSRIPYAAALNGDFFQVFSRVHPRLKFPHYSLLFIGSLAFVFSLLFRLSDVITAILMMRIFVQFISQAAGLILLRIKRKDVARPFTMPFFPVPAVISIVIWLFIFFSNEVKFMLYSAGIIFSGVGVYYFRKLYFTERQSA